MRQIGVIFFSFFPVVFLSLNLSCASSRSYYSRYLEAPPGEVFLGSAPNFEDPAFLRRWARSYNEEDKIRYLLDRIAHCEYRFIRNGTVHDGKKARQWFLYKKLRWVKDVETAQDFVTRVASFSQRTGKPYLIEGPNGEVYSMESVLKNELTRLETFLTRMKILMAPPVSRPRGTLTSAPAPLAKV